MSAPAFPTESSACQYIINLMYERCGIRLHQGKAALIQARLGKRMRQQGFADLEQYCHFLRQGAPEKEVQHVIEALTTNFTNFLREEDHFKFLVRHALPSVLAPDQKRFQIWSAACTTGEEPYSIAIYLSEHFPPLGGWDWRILASDVATKVLAKAEQGIYPEERVRMLPPEWLRKYFQRGTGRWEGHCRVKTSLSARVCFEELNLIAEYKHPQPYEVIFCRNVMIYFDRPTQERMVQRICRYLAPGGYLLVGHSESLNGLRLPLRCLRPSVYQSMTS